MCTIIDCNCRCCNFSLVDSSFNALYGVTLFKQVQTVYTEKNQILKFSCVTIYKICYYRKNIFFQVWDVVIVCVNFITWFLFYCLLCNHSFQNIPKQCTLTILFFICFITLLHCTMRSSIFIHFEQDGISEKENRNFPL